MKLKLVFFANFRELLDCAGENIEIEAGATVSDVCHQLAQKDGSWQAIFLNPSQSVKVAVNQQMSELNQTLLDGDEVAFFPPVTGG